MDVHYGLSALRDRVQDETLSGRGAGNSNHKREKLGAYLNFEQRYQEWLTLSQGGRFDDFETEYRGEKGGNDNWSWSLGAEVLPFHQDPIWSGLSIFANVGTGWRPPSASELFEESGRNVITLPNPNLEAETNRTWEIGLGYQKRNLFQEQDRASLRVNYFHQDIEDLIVGMPTSQPDELQLTNAGDDELHGVEFQARYDAPRYYGALVFDYTERDAQGTGLPGDPVQNRPWSLFGDLGARFFDHRLTLGAEIHYVSEFDAGESTLAGSSNNVDSNLFTDSYELVHLYATYELTEDSSLKFRVENVFNQDFRAYQTVDNGPGRNFIFAFQQEF
ncbi:TonB-dependent receptor domain-containing protein [Roseibacillus ishigakijimensis]|uniref:TonB-dependent receptor n=1 Tax=Roseibacillus ishigakijimensis TaxID=454146 RepID=A0A934RM75_9BACT|nr:TonB-dependent receptor [Roseibacillus ishigakijimensis]MBK1833954.1 TonB-dependent receptor [Roseibacillus ishigakijimensis]